MAARNIRRLVETVNGQPIEILRLLPEEKPVLHCVVIPGNPGSAGYYRPFMEALYALSRGRVELTAISALGIGVQGFGGKDFSVRAQAQHKVEYLRHHVLNRRDCLPIVLIGHSIGAYIAVEVAHKLQSLSAGDVGPMISKVISLFPFFEVDTSSVRQQILRSLTYLPAISGLLAGTLGCLPLGLQASLIRYLARGDLEDSALETTMSLCNYSAGYSVAAFGASEFRDLNVKSDTWLPLQQVADLRRELAELEIEEIDGVSHGFCVTAKQSQAVAEKVFQILGR